MMMDSKKIVTLEKTGVQYFDYFSKTLDSGFRRNDEMSRFRLFARSSNDEI